MSVSASSEPPTVFDNLKSSAKDSCGLQVLGSELTFTQEATGKYLSFYWQQAESYGLSDEQVIGKSLNETFAPVDVTAYSQRLQRILASMTPEHCRCLFKYKQNLWSFELVISPVPCANQPTVVLVMGRQLEMQSNGLTINSYPVNYTKPNTIAPVESKKLLIHIARNIRRTLDLNTIWQQTVDSLGEALGVSHCIVCAYTAKSPVVKVVAECRQVAVRSMVGSEILIAEDAGFSQALKTLEPVVVDQIDNPSFQQSLLVVATYYQGKPNGLISLRQCIRLPLPLKETNSAKATTPPRQWTADEIELVREVAEQVGTAIAHATLYKELEEARLQAEEASRLKSEFLANTSHEIRTPLNGMLGFLKLILEGMADDPQEQEEFIKEAYGSAIHLLHILNDILDIAKIEAGKMELELGRVKLDELLNHVESFSKPQAEQKKLSFLIQKPDTTDEIVVYGNYKRLLQVMLNLVSNALKFTDEGAITISADVVRKKVIFQNQTLPGIVKIRVVDTGIGVSLDKQEKLFQTFSQVDGSLTRPYGGTGLGLTISQKLVEAMGGEVYFFSMGEGLGSTVMFTIPLYQEPVMSSAPVDTSSEQ